MKHARIIDLHQDILYAFDDKTGQYSKQVSLSDIAHECKIVHASLFLDEQMRKVSDYDQRNLLLAQMHRYLELIRNDDRFKLITSYTHIETLRENETGIIIHAEGVDQLLDFTFLLQLQELGLRSVGLIWNLGSPVGVPAVVSSRGGLSNDGKKLVASLIEKRFIIDVAHLNTEGIEQVSEICDGMYPFVSTHTGCRIFHEHKRNLTDHEIRLIARSGGLIGLGLGKLFLGSPTYLSQLARQVHHICDIAGYHALALGSDLGGLYEGQEVIDCGSTHELHKVSTALSQNGIADKIIKAMLHDNAMNFYRRIFKSLHHCT